MKFYYCFIALFIFASCGGEEENSTQETHEGNTEESQTNNEETSDELDEENRVKYVISAEVGQYGEQAIFVLTAEAEDEIGISEVSGYYYYIKRRKNLDIEGQLDNYDDHFKLVESYKGETTGYIDIDLDNPDECFWSPAADTQDEQDLVVQLLDQGNPYELTVALEDQYYTYEHIFEMYMGEEEGWVEQESTDELYVTIVNEEYLLFDISVTGYNAHIGVANGTAKITGSKAIWTANDEWSECTLYFDLSNKGEQIDVTEEDCDGYHGHNAYFDGTYTRAD